MDQLKVKSLAGKKWLCGRQVGRAIISWVPMDLIVGWEADSYHGEVWVDVYVPGQTFRLSCTQKEFENIMEANK